MSEKNIKSRIVHKHDVESNWLLATNFVPKQGELIIYDKDDTHDYVRFKIGDGTTIVSSLPFLGTGKNLSGKVVHTNETTTVTAGVGAEVFNDYAEPTFSGDVLQTGNVASGNYSHAEGSLTLASGDFSHAEGCVTFATDYYDHAEGWVTQATGGSSHAEGSMTTASGGASHAEGMGTEAASQAQHVQGYYNIVDTEGDAYTRGKYAHIVGNGNMETRSNAHTLDWSGNGWFAGTVKVGGTGQDDSAAKELATQEYVDSNKLTVDSELSATSENPVQNKVVNTAISNLNTLVGDASVASQINTALTSNKSDWNQNDSTQANYIENRPFYSNGVTTTQVLPTTTLSASKFWENSGVSYCTLDYAPFLVDGQKYTVVCDGEKYECTAITVGDDELILGNPGLSLGALPDNSLPFSFYLYYIGETETDNGMDFAAKGDITDHTISIQAHIEDVVAIDKKYLSNTIGQQGAGLYSEVFNLSGNDASGKYSHAEGYVTSASGEASHTEGSYSIASGERSHAEGSSNASGECSHSEGKYTLAEGIGSHAEGLYSSSFGDYSHASGNYTQAIGESSHAEGFYTMSVGKYSHSEGYGNVKVNLVTADANVTQYKLASSFENLVGGYISYNGTVAKVIAYDSNTRIATTDITLSTTAFKNGKFYIYQSGVAFGTGAHLEGYDNTAIGDYTHAEGQGTKASSTNQHVQGKYNVEDAISTYAHIVGNGTSDSSRSNAHTIDWDGNAWFAGDIKIGGTGYSDSNAKAIATQEYVDNNKLTIDDALSSTSTNAVQNKVVNTAISNLQTLVGDTSVSSQITTAIDASKEYAIDIHESGGVINTLPNEYWYSIAYGAGKYVIISDDGYVYYSTDLQSWEQATIPTDYIECHKILYGNGKFVIIPYAGDETLYSTDGVNWNVSAFTIDAAWDDAIFEDGKFIVLGCNTYTVVAYSTDGITWSSYELPKSSNWRGIAYGNGKYVLSGNDSGTNFTLYSTDLETWNEASLPITRSFTDIAFGNGIFVMIADNGADYVYSSDGITWTQGTMPVSANWRCIEFGNGVFSVVTYNDTTALYSTDGINWGITYTPLPENWIDLVYTNNKFIIVACQSTYIAYSNDGIHWSSYLATSNNDVTSEVAASITPFLTSDTEPIENSKNIMNSGDLYNTFSDRIFYLNVSVGIKSSTNELYISSYTTNMFTRTLEKVRAGKNFVGIRARVSNNEYYLFYLDSIKYSSSDTSNAIFSGYYNSDKYVLTITYTASTDKENLTLVKFIDPYIPKSTSITLAAADWTGDANPYSQVVDIASVTANSKVDLQPTAAQIVELQDSDISLMTENNDGTITVYAIGGKPTVDYTMQVLITEVIPV